MNNSVWRLKTIQPADSLDLTRRRGRLTHSEKVISMLFDELMKFGIREPWKFCVYNDDYIATKSGRVFNICCTRPSKNEQISRFYRIRELRGGNSGNGYLFFSIKVNRRYKNIRAHRLVLSAFTGTNFTKKMVNHIDGNKLNNAVENLEWVTAQENFDHARKTGLWNDATTRTDKVAKRDYPLIYLHWKYAGKSKNSLCKMFSVSPNKINQVIAAVERVGALQHAD